MTVRHEQEEERKKWKEDDTRVDRQLVNEGRPTAADNELARLKAAIVAISGMPAVGAWDEADPRRAFVAGARWWEFAHTGFTMWPSDIDDAEAEATRRVESAQAVDAVGQPSSDIRASTRESSSSASDLSRP